MPPVRRAQKVGQRRIDAALDALRPMGFPRALVAKTVRNLLKVYGGHDGWTFIEDCSYKLLIDTIIEELENPQNDNNAPVLLIEDGPAKDQIAHSPTSKDVMPSPLSIEHPGKMLEPDMLLLPDIPSASTPSSLSNMGIVQCSLNDELLTVESGNLLPLAQISPEEVHFPILCPTVESLPPGKRRPCYGWLSSDDEEEQDLVSLVPTT